MVTTDEEIIISILLSSALVFISLGIFLGLLVFFQRKYIRIQLQLLQKEHQAIETERKRIALELHDDIGPMISSAKMFIQLQSGCPEGGETHSRRATEALDNVVKQIRSISFNLLPASLSMYGLKSAVTEYFGKMLDSSGIRYDITGDYSREHIREEDEVQLYRMVQEMLSNTMKHSGARHIVFDISSNQRGQIRFRYKDDGKGIEVEHQHGLGLKHLQMRARLIKAQIKLNTGKGLGTEFLIHYPYTTN